MKISSQSALGVNYQLSKTSAAIGRSLERLSTGRRVNGASDDQAAYSMGVKFESQVRGIGQANLNINQTLGLLNTADSAFQSQLDLLQRMREIAVQSSNGTLTSTERANLNTELQALLEEYRRIARDTDFNGTKLIDGTFTTKQFQIGANTNQYAEFDVASTEASDTFRRDVGTATYQSRATVSGGTGPYSVTTGDINNDGNQDMVVSEIGSSNNQGVLALYYGKGNGTFQSRVTIATGTDVRSIALEDINGDGVLDIITADYDDATVSVMKGNGDGTFQTRQTFVTGTNPLSVRVADFNGDGKKDLVVADYNAAAGTTASILMGNGDGTFQSRSTVLTGTGPVSIAVADFNGDNKQDLAIANAAGGANGVTMYFGSGNGTFVIQSTLTTGTTPSSIVSLDVNRDGLADLAIANGGTTTVTTFVNNGSGSFTNTATLTVGTSPQRMRAGDINNDGIDDLVVANQGSQTISVFTGLGGGQFTTGTAVSTGSSTDGAYDLRLVDLNNDGVLDLVAPNSGASGGTSSSGVSIFMALTANVTAEGEVNVSTLAKAQQLIKIVDTAILNVNKERSNLAAVHSRLEQSMAVNLLLQDNYTDALSKSVDVDVALETAELVKNQVLQQAQVAVAAQANVQMQTVLGLLKF